MSCVSRVLGWKGDGTRTRIDVRGVAGLKIGNGAYAPGAPGPGYTQMPYQEGTGHSDFRPPQERP